MHAPMVLSSPFHMFQAIKSRVSYAVKLPLRSSISTLSSYSHDIAAQYSAPVDPPSKLYVRQAMDQGIINVFDQNGVKLWTIECSGLFSNEWTIYAADRTQLATIKLGAFVRNVHFIKATTIESAHFNRDWRCLGMFNCVFTLKDGTSYVWTSQSKFLERIIDTSDNKEIRERVASAKLLRSWKCDWEISYSPLIDPLVVLATAFMPMYSQWDLSSSSRVYRPQIQPTIGANGAITTSAMASATVTAAAAAAAAAAAQHLDCSQSRQQNGNTLGNRNYEYYSKYLVYEPDTTDLAFFNPPTPAS